MIEFDRLYPLINETIQTLRKRLVFVPQPKLTVNATLLGDPLHKRVLIEYNPEKCPTEDMARELLRIRLLCDDAWRRVEPMARDSNDKFAKDAAKLIGMAILENKINDEMLRNGFSVESQCRNEFAADHDSVVGNSLPFNYILDPRLRLLHSSLRYARFLLTRTRIDYGASGEKHASLYRSSDPAAVELGEQIANIIVGNQCETSDGSGKACSQIISLFQLENRLVPSKDASMSMLRGTL